MKLPALDMVAMQSDRERQAKGRVGSFGVTKKETTRGKNKPNQLQRKKTSKFLKQIDSIG